MQSVVRRVALWCLAALGCCAAAACITTTSSSATLIYPTTVTLSPKVFAGSVTCARVPGAWQTYVATLTDVTDPSRPFQLASSMPVSCSMPVSFYFVIPGHSYIATIDGYDRSDIVAFGSPTSGSPHMIDPQTGLDVAPRWRSQCPAKTQPVADAGLDAEPPMDAADEASAAPQSDASDDAGRVDPSIPGAWVAVTDFDVAPNNCSALEELLPPLPGSLMVDLSSIRDDLMCGSAINELDHFRVTPIGSALGAKDAKCDEKIVFSPVTAGLAYRFRVDAFEHGADAPRWASECLGVARQGLTLPATCDTLTTEGAFRIDIAALLKDAGHTCAANDIVRYRVAVTGTNLPIDATVCASDTLVSPLSAGTWHAVVEAFDATNKVQITAWCQAIVSPAATATASCVIQ